MCWGIGVEKAMLSESSTYLCLVIATCEMCWIVGFCTRQTDIILTNKGSSERNKEVHRPPPPPMTAPTNFTKKEVTPFLQHSHRRIYLVP